MYSRVSEPDLGANNMPIPTPTPNPSKNADSPFLSMCSPSASSWLDARPAILSILLGQGGACVDRNNQAKKWRSEGAKEDQAQSGYTSGSAMDKDRKARRLDKERLWNYALRALGGRAHST